MTVASQEGHIRLIFEAFSLPFSSQAYRSNQRFLWHGPDILGALVMAASSVLGYPGQARLEDVPFWSVAYALVTMYCGHCMPSSLLFRATETDALIVCINGVVLAMNLMLLSLTLQVASSGTSIFLAMLLLEFELFFFRSCQHCHWIL